MQNQYFVKGLGFGQRQEPQETRSYGRIKKTPYSAYNNRSYNLNYRDIRLYNDRIKRLIAIINSAIKNQAATMFKYLSIYVQNRQQEEIRAQLRVIQEGLLRFQHAISLYNQRLKCLGFFRIAKVDVMSHLKKELRIQISQSSIPITHQIFKKWMQMTFETKCNRLLKQQQQNMVSFYKFTLNKILCKQESLKVWSFNKLRITQRKLILERFINNLGLQLLRLSLYNAEQASLQYLHNPRSLEIIVAFQKIKHYHYFNPNQHYFLLTLTNIINSRLNALRTMFISSIIIVDRKVPQEQMASIDLELARQSYHCKLEHQKSVQRIMKYPQIKSPIALLEILRFLVSSKMSHAFNKFKGQKQIQDLEVQDGVVKNLSIIAAKLSQKIKTKHMKSQKLDITFKLEQIFHKNYDYEKRILKDKFRLWQYNITFPPSMYHDFEIRLKVLQNEKEVLMTDIEQLEIMNNELTNSMNQVKKTFLSEESNFNTSNKNEQRQIEIQKFDILENFTSQEDLKIGFEYVDFLKEQNIDLKNQYQNNEQVMIQEMQKLEAELKELEKQLFL